MNRLTGRVATADHDDLLACTQLRFHERRAVVHACAFELREVFERWLTVLSAGGNDHRARNDALAVCAVRHLALFLPAIFQLTTLGRANSPVSISTYDRG